MRCSEDDADCAPPPASQPRPPTPSSPLSLQEDYVNQLFDRLYESLPKRQRGFVQEHLSAGSSDVFFGAAWADALSSQLVQGRDVSVLFMGALENNPTDMEDGEYILNEYLDACGGPRGDDQPPSLDVLVQLEANAAQGYAFIIFDRRYGRLTVARDPEGTQPLFWGTTAAAGGVLFASDAALLASEEEDCSDAAAFPAGAVFISEDGGTAGSVATVGAKTLLHPDLCRVESANNFVGIFSSMSE